jgi:hypothetical protein
MIGLIDAFRFTGNRQALDLIAPTTDAVLPFLPGRALDRAETQANPGRTWPLAGTRPIRWRKTSTLPPRSGRGTAFARWRRAIRCGSYLDPLAAGRNVLAGRHAYSHVNALASAMRGYMHEGDPALLAAARNGMGFVAEQSFATGGWGPDEAFVEAGSGGLGASLGTTHRL